jgi:hypothetical protein
MPNLRIIYDNAADRATVTTSTTAGSLAASNMKIDKKSKVWRSTNALAASTIITATWTTSEIIGGVILPFCNLSAAATIKIKLYTLSGDASPVYDTGFRPAATYTSVGVGDWGVNPLGVNAYSYGGGTYGVAYFPKQTVRKIIIEIVDTANTAGYIECSRLVAGAVWSPTYNMALGTPMEPIDTSTNDRSESGDLITTRGIRYRTLSFDLTWLLAVDRQRVNEIKRGNGKTKSLFVSLFPEDVDTEKEQIWQIYGRLKDIGAMTHDMPTIYSTSISIEEF